MATTTLKTAIAWLACGCLTVAAASDPRPELALGRDSLHDYDPPVPGSYELPPLQPAADGQVLGSDGKPRQLRDLFRGKITVLAFVYTRCTDPRACPYATRVLYQLHQVSEQDKKIADEMQLISFSFDPEHDTPEVMAEFGKTYEPVAEGSPWWLLTTRSMAELRPILTGYGQVIDRKKKTDDQFGPIAHQLRVYLIDRAGMIRNIYSYAVLDPRLVMADVRTLLLEESHRRVAEH
jgi:protein SCO1/2